MLVATLSDAEDLWGSPYGDVQSVCVLKDGLDPFQITESESGNNVCFHFLLVPNFKNLYLESIVLKTQGANYVYAIT